MDMGTHPIFHIWEKARRLNKTALKGVRVLGVDGTGQKVKGQGANGVLMGVDLESGLLLETTCFQRITQRR